MNLIELRLAFKGKLENSTTKKSIYTQTHGETQCMQKFWKSKTRKQKAKKDYSHSVMNKQEIQQSGEINSSSNYGKKVQNISTPDLNRIDISI